MIGVVLMVVGFIVGNACGYLLSKPSVMKPDGGEASKSKQTLYATVIAVSAVLILVGQFIWSAPHSYVK
ncbi:MAG: hypothetical protein MUE33_00480 [Cytophagaceae bacterium]|jgi:hypothetical protein|nr:hypothetical protein [Cytophagaceae bacterium]